MFTTNKIKAFKNPISALPDVPQMPADKLKAHFDACPEELRAALNGLIDELCQNTAAEQLGFMKSAGVQAENIQQAIENVHNQLCGVALENVPDGSIGKPKLDADLQAELQEISSQLTQLSNQITQGLAEAEKKRIKIETGAFTGDGANVRNIPLTIEPKAVFLLQEGIYTMAHYARDVGGLATPEHPIDPNGRTDLRILEVKTKSFNVMHYTENCTSNEPKKKYVWIAFG